MEALACQEIFTRAEHDQVRLAWSFMHEDETLLCPFPERRYEAARLSSLCKVRVGPEQEIYKLAKSFQQGRKMSAKDAIHLGCAAYIKADYFLTCDDKLLKQSKRLMLKARVMNPIDFIIQG
jgi:hypothetical protein